MGTIFKKKVKLLPVAAIAFKTALFSMLIATFVSCEKDADSFRHETRVSGKVSFLDVLDARALIIGGEESSLKSDGPVSVAPGSSLFKVTEDGVIQEIRYWQIDTVYIETEKGTDIEIDSVEMTTIIYPVHVFNVTDDYLIVSFNEENEDDIYHPWEYDFLVRKSDGAVYEMPPGRRPVTYFSHFNQMFANEDVSSAIQSDLHGNVYFMGAGDIYKLSLLNPQNLTLEQLTTGGNTGEGVMNYRVNGDGHIVFSSGGISTQSVTRIRYNGGGLAYPEKSIVPYWVGFDNNFYFSYTPPYSLQESMMPVIGKMQIENDQVNYETTGIIDHPESELTYLESSYIFKMKNINKIVVMQLKDNMEERGKVVAEVYNSEGSIRAFPMSELGLTSIKIGISSDNYYYITGMDNNQPVILKVDPSIFPHSAEHLVPKGELDIYEMVVSADDYITFHGLRMSDGKTITGTISPDGTVNEMEEIGTAIMQLAKIQ